MSSDNSSGGCGCIGVILPMSEDLRTYLHDFLQQEAEALAAVEALAAETKKVAQKFSELSATARLLFATDLPGGGCRIQMVGGHTVNLHSVSREAMTALMEDGVAGRVSAIGGSTK